LRSSREDASACLPLDHGGPVDRPFEPFPRAALEGSIVDRFDAIARRFAPRLAIEDRDRSFTYGELAVLVADIAAATAAAAAGRPGPVAILLPNEARFPATMLGVLAAGRGYVPLDADHPRERNRWIAEHAGVAAVVSAGTLVSRVAGLFSAHIPVLDLDDLGLASAPNPGVKPRPGDLAYILYTSGSTGRPKGVYQSHRNLIYAIMQCTHAWHVNCEDRMVQLYSPSVTAANLDIYPALLNGASLHILPPREVTPAVLAQELRERRITIYHSIPPLFRHVASKLGAGARFDDVRMVCLAGDRFGWGDVDLFSAVCPDHAFLYLAIGCTECATAPCTARARTCRSGGRFRIAS
jgi:non-ribosomal peptide synthetase component F